MAKTSSVLIIAMFLIMSSSLAVVVANSDMYSDVDGAVDYSTDDWIKISNPSQLSKIGDEYPLDGDYVLTNDIDFTAAGGVDLNGGFDIKIGATHHDTYYVTVTLYHADGTTLMKSGQTMVVSLNGEVRAINPGQSSYKFTTLEKPSSLNITAGGNSNNVPDPTEPSYFAFSVTLDFGDGTSVMSDAVNSNGNMDPIQGVFEGTFHGDGYKIIGLETSEFGTNTVYSALFTQVSGARFDGIGMELGSSSSVSATTVTHNSSIAGSLAGSGNSTFTNCYNTGTVSSSAETSTTNVNAYAGGLAGYGNSTFTNCYNAGTVLSSTSARPESGLNIYSHAGGLLGFGNPTMTNCYNTGTVSASALASASNTSSGSVCSYAGGLVGGCSMTLMVTIKNCYNTGSVSAIAWSVGSNTSSAPTAYAGGITSRSNVSVTITNCYNTGDIISEGYKKYAGGIIGFTEFNITITNCYNTGDIICTGSNKYAGGIVGSGPGGSFKTIITNCYFHSTNTLDLVTALHTAIIDGQSGIRDSSPSGRVPLDDMKIESSYFKGTGGWDFTNIWRIDAAVNDGLPYLFNKITKQPADVTAYNAVGNELSVETNFIPAGVQWQKNSGGMWANIPGATHLTYTTGMGDVFGDEFQCVITDPDGTDITSLSAQLFKISVDITVGINGKLIYDGADITGNRSLEINETSMEFTIEPDDGFVMQTLMLDGVDIKGTVSDQKFTVETMSGRVLAITFTELVQHRITASVDTAVGGSISPSGTVMVTHGENEKFIVTVNAGYSASVWVDGINLVQLKDGGYTFTNVTKDHIITVTFEVLEYSVTLDVGDNGTAVLSKDTTGGNDVVTVTVTPNEGFDIKSVTSTSGTIVKNGDVYELKNVKENCTVTVTFSSNEPSGGGDNMTTLIIVGAVAAIGIGAVAYFVFIRRPV